MRSLLFVARWFLAFLPTGFCLSPRLPAAEPAPAVPRPNLVVILADDLGRADVGFNGGKVIQTPHLDRLAASGTRLDAFYVQPVCSPTRAAFLTGRYPMRHGLQVGVVRPWAQYGLPLEERTLPQALRQAGYQTAIVGKWHLGHFRPDYLPTRRGFDQQYGHYNGALDYFSHERDGGFDWHRNDRVCRDAGYATHLLGREAVRFVRERDRTRPFFLYLAFNAVHSPHQVPDSYKTSYAQLPEPRRTYAGMLVAMDEAIGQLVAALEAEGLRDSTLVFFSSDNGGPAPGRVTDNGPFRAGKGTLYEGGVRVAAFVTWPGRIPAAHTVREPLHIVDWYPTLLRLAGAPLPQEPPLDGRDLWPVLTAGRPSPHDEILLNTTPTSGALRRGDWKLVLNGGRSETGESVVPANARPGRPTLELFNLATDPGEQTNVAAAYPDRVQALRMRYEVWARQAVSPKARPKPTEFVSPRVWGETDGER